MCIDRLRGVSLGGKEEGEGSDIAKGEENPFILQGLLDAKGSFIVLLWESVDLNGQGEDKDNSWCSTTSNVKCEITHCHLLEAILVLGICTAKNRHERNAHFALTKYLSSRFCKLGRKMPSN